MERYYRIARDVHGLSIFTDEKYKTHTEAIVEARKLFKTSIVKPKEIRVSEWQEGRGAIVLHGRSILIDLDENTGLSVNFGKME